MANRFKKYQFSKFIKKLLSVNDSDTDKISHIIKEGYETIVNKYPIPENHVSDILYEIYPNFLSFLRGSYSSQKKAIKRNAEFLFLMKNPSSKITIYAIKKKPYIWDGIKNPSPEIRECIISLSAYAISQFRDPSPREQMIAMKKDLKSFDYIKEPTLEVQMMMIPLFMKNQTTMKTRQDPYIYTHRKYDATFLLAAHDCCLDPDEKAYIRLNKFFQSSATMILNKISE